MKLLGRLEMDESSYTILSFPSSQLPKDYMPLVFARWLRSFRKGCPLYKKISNKHYYETYHRYIENLMLKPDSLTRIAVLTDDQDVALGFSVSREDVLDYIHVHTDYRRNGIAKVLMPEGIIAFTHITDLAIIIWQTKEKYKKLEFKPFV